MKIFVEQKFREIKTFIFGAIYFLRSLYIHLYRNRFKELWNMKKTKIILLFIGLFVISQIWCNRSKEFSNEAGFKSAIKNYKTEVDKYAKQFGLPSEYLMALIMLESSGVKDVPPRFELKIYDQLKLVKAKKREHLENIDYSDLENASDNALRNLAKSWGPFQLMGYKCIHLGIKLEEMRGENAVFHGVYWINETYGTYLKQKRFKDAFHIHNTGREYPKNGNPLTYDPDYVRKGLSYMRYFQQFDSINLQKK